MAMLELIVELFRGRYLDERKALAWAAGQATAEFRELVADHDAFVRDALEIEEPAFMVGMARDSAGDEIPIRLPEHDLYCHWLVSGGTGTGKTTFVTGVVAALLRGGYPAGVLDCKSGFFDAALRSVGAIAHTMDPQARAHFVRRLVVVNPFGEALVPLNVCRLLPGTSAEVQAYEVALALSRLFDASMGFQMENILRHLLLLLIESRLTLVEAPLVLRDELLRGLLAERSGHPAVREFFLRTFPTVPQASKDALLARLESLLLPENLRLMLGADDLVDLPGALDRGDPLFIFLGKGPGVPEEQVEVMGSLILQLLFQAAYAKGKARRPYQLVCDEFFHLLDAPGLGKRFETGLTSLRSYGVSLGLVMHQFSQVPGGLREAILGNCDLVATFRTSGRNAQFFGDFLPETDPEVIREALRRTGRPPGKFEVKSQLVERLQRLPNRHCYWYDRRKRHRAVLIRVPDLPAPHQLAGLPEARLEEFMAVSGIRTGGAALSKAVLRAQIEGRRMRLRELVSPPVEVRTTEEPRPDPPAPVRFSRQPRVRLG
jgi:hypothetical protein